MQLEDCSSHNSVRIKWFVSEKKTLTLTRNLKTFVDAYQTGAAGGAAEGGQGFLNQIAIDFPAQNQDQTHGITSAHRSCALNTTPHDPVCMHALMHYHTHSHTQLFCTPLPPPSNHPPILPLLLFPNTHKTQTQVALTTADENTGSTKAMLITSTSCGNTKVVLF